MAAQSLVGISYDEPKLTYETNLFGTLNILEALRSLKKDCVHFNHLTNHMRMLNGYGVTETDKLGGKDPYSASKASTEIMINSYVNSFSKNNFSKIGIVEQVM